MLRVIDPFRGYATGLTDRLDATIVVDHFHAIRLANKAIDDARRRACYKNRSVIVVDATIRCIGSAVSCSSVTNASPINNTNGYSRCWVTATDTVTSPRRTSPRNST
ncbi:MAG: Transposase [Actinomycetia bacterium]|nr:Transposase [Actinomycetes bacterium]